MTGHCVMLYVAKYLKRRLARSFNTLWTVTVTVTSAKDSFHVKAQKEFNLLIHLLMKVTVLS